MLTFDLKHSSEEIGGLTDEGSIYGIDLKFLTCIWYLISKVIN